MEIRFEIETDSLTIGDMLLIEDVQEGKRPVHSMVSLLARYMADENGLLLGETAGVARLAALKIPEFTEVAKSFAGAIQRKAIPPKISGG
jgi:hypothetical protein